MQHLYTRRERRAIIPSLRRVVRQFGTQNRRHWSPGFPDGPTRRVSCAKKAFSEPKSRSQSVSQPAPKRRRGREEHAHAERLPPAHSLLLLLFKFSGGRQTHAETEGQQSSPRRGAYGLARSTRPTTPLCQLSALSAAAERERVSESSKPPSQAARALSSAHCCQLGVARRAKRREDFAVSTILFLSPFYFFSVLPLFFLSRTLHRLHDRAAVAAMGSARNRHPFASARGGIVRQGKVFNGA